MKYTILIYETEADFGARTDAKRKEAYRGAYRAYTKALTDGYFGLPDLTPVAVYGSPNACVRGLREVAEAGAELILLNPLFGDAEQMERLSTEVVPQLS